MNDGTLQGRYTITHKDGKPVDPEKSYFVLEISPAPDQRELAAIQAYIAACERTGYPELATSIQAALPPHDELSPADRFHSQRDIHSWFELTYAQYLTIPRSVLQSMPDAWQRRFVKCLEELDELIDWRPKDGEQYRVTLHRPREEYADQDDPALYWGPERDDPLMDYRRGRRRIPHRAPARPDSWPRCWQCDADELVTLAPASTLIAAVLVETPLIPYLAHGVKCLACGHTDERPPRALQETPASWLVRVGNELRNTEQGQLYAIRSIPQDQRRRISSYRFNGEVVAGAFRWWRFLVTYQEGAPR